MDPDAIYEAPFLRRKYFLLFCCWNCLFREFLFSVLSHVDITVSSRGKFVTSAPNGKNARKVALPRLQ